MSGLMRRCLRGFGRSLLLGLLLASASAQSAPQRIISLDLCMDWLLALHAEPEQVAALSPIHRRYQLPFDMPDWSLHDGSLEQIYQLQPDLILVGEYNALLLRRRLEALSLPVVDLSLPTSLAEIEGYERQFLELIGQPPSRARPAPAPAQPEGDAPRLLLLGANGIGTGAGTFEDQILRQAGWHNYLRDTGYIRLDLEQLVADPPDAILWSAPASPSLASRFAEHPALQQVVTQEGWLSTDYWRWQCPGPWTWELIEQLKRKRVQ
jgi:iron complex transport system substrate-binding protein